LSPDAAQRLDLAEQARGAFLAQMSHEIRTPLNAILGMSQLLELEAPTPKQLDRLRRIEEASHHLLGIVNDILDYSKVQAGGLHLEREAIDLSTLLDRSLSLVTEKARTKHLDLQVQVAEDVPRQLVGDGRRVEQILVNLLTNAVKFTHNGSVTVAVSSSTASDSRVVLQVEVIDTGIGVAPEELGQLFTPFRQLRQGHARTFGGTGLGLSISRQLARAMNGECGVRSIPGRGSTFWFTAQLELPQGGALNPRVAAPAPLASPHASGHAGRCVLLVEDNDINRLVVRELLKKVADVQVVEAVDGLQSLELARQRHYDLVLMDIQMPGLDGLQATRQMRLLPGYDKVPIYALSANVHADDVNACLTAGMNGHLGKPLAVSQLQALLRGLWGQPVDAPAVAGTALKQAR
jgi:CheY-like chemotaxis protein